MKNISAVFSTLALIGVLVLFGLYFTNNKKADSGTSAKDAKKTEIPKTRIAYVNVDTLEANYQYLKDKKDEFQKKQASMEAELERSATQMDNDARNIQSKAQAGTLTKDEYEAAQKRLTQMQQSLITRKQALTNQLMQEQEDFNKDLKSRLDNFLTNFNKDKHYDYILSYGSGGGILYADTAYNITWDVINGMNAESKADSVTKGNK